MKSLNKKLTENFDWEVGLKPLGTIVSGKNNTIKLDKKQPAKMHGYKVVYRKDNDTALGIVTDQYIPIQNMEIINAIKPFLNKFDASKVYISTKGDGKSCHIQVRDKVENMETMKKGDTIGSGYNISWGHAGGANLKIEPFFMRLECENGMVTQEIQDNVFKIRHRFSRQVVGNPKENEEHWTRRLAGFLEKVKADTDKTMQEEIKRFKKFSTIELTDKQRNKIVAEIFPLIPRQQRLKNDGTPAIMATKIFQLEDYLAQEQTPAYADYDKNNLWGLYNCFTHYLTHHSSKIEGVAKSKFATESIVRRKLVKAYNVCNDYAQKAA